MKHIKHKKRIQDHKIGEYRKSLGLSQSDFAVMLDMTQQRLSMVENGKNFLKSYEIDRLLKVLGNVTFDELYNTGRLSIYLSKENQNKLTKYVKKLKDMFPSGLNDYQRKSILVNHILELFFDGKISGVERLNDLLKSGFYKD